MEQIVNFYEHGGGVIIGELVRCKECRWYLPTGYGKNRKCYRPNRGGNGGHRVKETDYCSYGERRCRNERAT